MVRTPRIAVSTSQSVSEPSGWPAFPRAGMNVVLVVLDDLGFAQLGCFGSDIDTPGFDALAAGGLRFTNFHTTALCSPTRACLLTGRNHHRVGVGFLPDVPMRFPGYTGRIPPEAATLAEILSEVGYATFAIGKWHLTPRDERTPAGPYAQWPLRKGFDRFYGFLGGDSNQWTPDLVRDNTYVEPPRRPEEGYHLSEDLADRAIAYVRELRVHQPERPFFLYLAPGATHAPHHVPREWIERYAGRFDDGWDVWRERTLERQRAMGVVPDRAELSARPRWVQEWATLPSDERRLYARMQEVFAGFASHADHHVGRVMTELEATGELDRTMVLVVSDNGCSSEGGPHGSVNELRFIADLHEDLAQNLELIDELGGFRTYNHYPWGWALAGNTPLRRWKRYTWEGGIRDPFILRWPGRVRDAGGVRAQYCHAVDVLPTVLEALDVPMPERVRGVAQMSVDGVSLATLVDDAAAREVRATQYYEMWGSRAIYHDGWKAVTDHVNQQHRGERELTDGSADFATDQWLLFDVRDDFSEVHDRAEEQPAKLRELVDRWWVEAGRNGVLPLDDGIVDRFPHVDFRWLRGRSRYELHPGAAIHEEAGPSLVGTDFAMVAVLDGPLAESHEGVLCEQGDWTNGWAWFVADRSVTWVLNYVGEASHAVRVAVPVGATTLGFSFTRRDGGGGVGRVLADGAVVHEEDVPLDVPFRWSPNGAFLTVGFGRGFPVCDDYRPPFRFDGPLARVVVTVGDASDPDSLRAVGTALRHQ
ncbi:MAG TPA: arylsulfatase [Acidimicrobiia bacterium]